MKVLILAGGFATRLWPLTEKRAKPLLTLGGKPIIGHILDKIPKEYEVIVSTNKAFEAAFRELFLSFPDRKLELFIEDSESDDAKVGALAATSLAIRTLNIDEPLLLIAGDNYFDFPLNDFIRAYDGTPMIAVFDTRSLFEAKKFGVVTVSGDAVTAFSEKPENPASTLVSTGIYLFPPDIFPEIISFSRTHRDNLGSVFEHLLSKTAIHAFRFTGKWIDIGSFQAYLDAHKVLCVSRIIPKSVTIEASTIGNHTDIGEHTRISGSTIENSIIGKDCVITHCEIRNSIVDDHSRLSEIDLDHKMIRSGSEISR
jgi:glucose-1-phosphate thymidylyltransferase